MRHIAVSALSLFVILPAWANARLPVVNIAAGGVSARAAFGDVVATPAPARVASAVPAVSVAPAPATKKVVARSAKKSVASAPVVTAQNASVDTGERIVARDDILSPHRPSADLWARSTSDAPLRMPDASEFAVYRTDSLLPEEDIDSSRTVTSPARTVIARAENASANVPTPTAALSEFDAQIAHLNELQQRANASVAANSATVSDAKSARRADVTVRSPIVSTPTVATAKVATTNDNVSLSRLVVPMDNNDVIVRAVEKSESPRIAAVRDDMTKMSPTELRKAFRKTFLSENKHLSTYQMDNRFDVASDMTTSIEGFTSRRDLSEVGGIRPLEIKIKFRDDDSALSRDNYNLLSEYAGIVVANPTRAIQVGIPQNVANSNDARKLAARRLAIVEQVLRDSGVSEQRILPVLSQRNEDGFVLRMISNDQYETLTQKRRDIFGDTIGKKTYKSMSW
ncbi:MAG: hypothetical protein Q4E56_00990 [Pseudomonadota bacterium]|nr:hypothetical protein [Pseudomonadota bacterium]